MGKKISQQDRATVFRFLKQIQNIGHFKFDDKYIIAFPNNSEERRKSDYKLIAESTKVIEGTLEDDAKWMRPTDKGLTILWFSHYKLGVVMHDIRYLFGDAGSLIAIIIAIIALILPYCNEPKNTLSEQTQSQTIEQQYKTTPSEETQLPLPQDVVYCCCCSGR